MPVVVAYQCYERFWGCCADIPIDLHLFVIYNATYWSIMIEQRVQFLAMTSTSVDQLRREMG